MQRRFLGAAGMLDIAGAMAQPIGCAGSDPYRKDEIDQEISRRLGGLGGASHGIAERYGGFLWTVSFRACCSDRPPRPGGESQGRCPGEQHGFHARSCSKVKDKRRASRRLSANKLASECVAPRIVSPSAATRFQRLHKAAC